MAGISSYDFLKPEVFNRISSLELRAKKIADGFMNGIHRSPYIGNSIEFASHRQYVPGDDIKNLDWKIWGRTDKLFIKQYEEETNLDCHFVLDISNSMRYGDSKVQNRKIDYALTLIGTLAWLMNRQGDNIGLTTFDDSIKLNIAAKSHPSHLKMVFHELQKIEPSNKTDMNQFISGFINQLSHKGIVVLVSDLFTNVSELENALKVMQYKKQEVIIFHVMHNDEVEFPFQGNIQFKGMENVANLQADSLSLKSSYLEVVSEYLAHTKKMVAKYGFEYAFINTKDPIGAALSTYLNYRMSKV